jgi:hypothetical protein
VARLLEQVKQQGALAAAPTREELHALAERLSLGGIAWVGIRPQDKDQHVRLAVYRRGDGGFSLLDRRFADAGSAEGIAAMIAWSLGPLAGAAKPAAEASNASPWYRRWWVWVAAGAVTAAITAGAVYAALPGDDFTVQIQTRRR